jgi:GTP cyclohydrolase I
MARAMEEIATLMPEADQSAMQGEMDIQISNLQSMADGQDADAMYDIEEESLAAKDDIIADALTRNTIYTAKYKLTGHSLHVKFRNIAQHYWICDPTVQEMKDQSFCGYYDPMSIQEATQLYPQIQDNLEEFMEFAEYNQNGAYQAGSVLNNLAIHARDSVPVMGIPVESGVGQDPLAPLSEGMDSEQRDPVILRDIELVSICEHHLLPFTGVAHIAYLPQGKIVGLGRLAQLVEVLAARPQLQENLTNQIADALVSGLAPRGALVILEARHQCVASRGARQPEVNTTTLAARGELAEPAARTEIITLITARQ